jgi:hypothetical protein
VAEPNACASPFAVLPAAVDFGSETEWEETNMPSNVRVEAARIPDRNRLLEALREEGLDARPEDEIGILIPVGEGGNELFHQVEGVVFSVGAPFVPIQHEGVIYIRPPVG